MTRINKKINKIIEKVTSLYLTNGVQPHELVESAFIENYESFEIKKSNGKVVLDMIYVETDEECGSVVKMRYVYDGDKKLQSICQKINSGKFVSQWNRQEAMTSYLNSLEKELRLLNSETAVASLLATLPKDIVQQIAPELRLVA